MKPSDITSVQFLLRSHNFIIQLFYVAKQKKKKMKKSVKNSIFKRNKIKEKQNLYSI